MLSFLNGKLSNAKKDTNSSKLERETDSEQELAEYQSLIEAHKKNQTLLRQRYYAAIYSVQQRFTQLFENIPRSNLIDSKSSQPKKVQKAALATNNEQYKFDYTYSFAQTPQFVEFYCTCPGWTIGSRCQFSGWIILLGNFRTISEQFQNNFTNLLTFINFSITYSSRYFSDSSGFNHNLHRQHTMYTW